MKSERLQMLPLRNVLEVSERKAMGFPEHFVPHFDPGISDWCARLIDCDTVSLARTAESLDASIGQRFASGWLLGLIGDPRINTLDPAMLDVSGGNWAIGTSLERVNEVASQLAPLGVQLDWIMKEMPRHITKVQEFRIAKYPVTNHEYLTFMVDSGTSEIPTSWTLGRYPHERSNHPVYTVSPEAADGYARWLAKKTGRKFRLPFEAEWEIAAGGGEREFPWGDSFELERCNSGELALLSTTPVGVFPGGAAFSGAFDMAGNVEEIVADMYAPYPGGTIIEDDLSKAGPYRMTRGGAFSRFQDLARCSRRHGWIRHSMYPIGFRLAESL